MAGRLRRIRDRQAGLVKQRLLQRATTTAPTCRAASWPRSGRPTRGRIAWTIRRRRRRAILRAFCRRAMACSRLPRRWRRGSTGTSPSRTRRSTWSGTRTAGRSIISRLAGAPTVPPLVPPRLAHRHSTPPVLSIIMVSKRLSSPFDDSSKIRLMKNSTCSARYYLHATPYICTPSHEF